MWLHPRESVTVSLTVKVPVPQPKEVNECDGFAATEFPPSPKSHLYEKGAVPLVIAAVKTTAVPEQALLGVNEKLANGIGLDEITTGPIVVSGLSADLSSLTV